MQNSNQTRELLAEYINTQPQTNVMLMVGFVLTELFSRQTEEEKSIDHTKENNNMGFASCDARSGSKCAKSFIKRGSLQGWQVEQWTKLASNGLPRICKYHRQIDFTGLLDKINKYIDVNTKETIENARIEYLKIANIFVAATGYNSNEFKQFVTEKVISDNPSPQDWINAALSVHVKCTACGGKGKYYTTNYSSDCFRCNGKGYQDYEDAKRNYYYDKNNR